MVCSAVKYLLFALLLVGIGASSYLLTADISYTGFFVQSTTEESGEVSQLAGNAMQDQVGPNALVILVLVFILVSGFLFSKWQNRSFYKELLAKFKAHESYVSVILRLLIAIFLLVSALDFAPSVLGYGWAILKILLALLLVFGLFTRIIAYLVLFYLISLLLFPAADIFAIILLIGITLCILLLGGDRYSLDHDLWK
ncbi:MAG: hypothetical protein V1743_00695 [Nanoarchaeota archaeon]